MGLDWLTQLKNFLADRPETAFLALSLGANAYLFKLLMNAKDAQLTLKDAQLTLALQWLPVVKGLEKFLESVVQHKNRNRRPNEFGELPDNKSGE